MRRTALGEGVEFDVIRRILDRARPPGRGVLVGPGDDCAVIGGGPIAVSTDVSVEGVHFRREWLEPGEIGYRATAASLSDLAAMAARPAGILVSVVAPRDDVPELVEALVDGAREAVEAAGGELLGGDLAGSPGPLIVDIVALGRVDWPMLRSTAGAGDEVWVTGRLGGAAAAVRSWLAGREPHAAAREAYARPRPRIEEAAWLAERGVPHALIDISDGLAGDAGHLAAASGVGIVIDAGRVPVHEGANRSADGPEDALRLAIAGGEDYELCFTSSPGAVEEIKEAFEAAFDATLTRVGTVT